jgi:hypothetical protein
MGTVDISINAKVVTSDGKELGKVKKIEGPAFQVDAPMALDYWLASNLAGTSTAEKVELLIAESDVAGYKMDNPHDHNEFKANVAENLKPSTVQGQTLRR